jgi:hypothetical protein
MVFADNWRVAAKYLALYGKIATVVFGVAAILFLWRFFRKRRGASGATAISDKTSINEGLNVED